VNQKEAVMFAWLKALFRVVPVLPERVTFDDERVVRTMRDGRTEQVRWSDLREVGIVTTDAGPLVDDVFWVLIGDEGGCIVPSEAEGAIALLTRLQQLPGFDDGEVIRAMGCTDNERFVAWQRATRAA
jgi:hypothetical protein